MADDFSNLLSIEFVSLSEAKAKLSEQVRRVLAEGKRMAITTNGKPTAVLLSYEDYLSLIRKLSQTREPQSTRVIDFKEWKKTAKKRTQVRDSILNLFDPPQLSRKGQKAYKRDTVHEFGKRLAKKPAKGF